MPEIDLLIRGGTVITGGTGSAPEADVLIADGKIVALVPPGAGGADQVLDATGCLVFPGFIDAHIHLNEPGRADWEGLDTGTAALAAGGVTTFFDMPLNSDPPVITAADFEKKRALALEKSRIDFALWGGLVEGNVGELAGMAEAGAIGFKAFLCNSGIAEFPRADPATLQAGARECARLGKVLAVHAEDEALAAELARNALAAGRTDWRAYLDSRPVEVELRGIHSALEAAQESGCRLHVVHVSSPAGLRMIREAREAGVRVTAETCPHYLLLDEEALGTLGAVAKCAPPLRPRALVEELWDALVVGLVDTIGSDHSPSPPDMKQGADFFRIWGGIAGAQHGFPLFISAALSRGLAPGLLAQLTSSRCAHIFGLKGKGVISPGADADLALVHPRASAPIRAEELLYRHQLSPYVGMPRGAQITHTLLRGRVIAGENAKDLPAQEVQFPAL